MREAFDIGTEIDEVGRTGTIVEFLPSASGCSPPRPWCLPGEIQRQEAPTDKTLKKKQQPLQRSRQEDRRGLHTLPAPEGVELSCPKKLVYYATDLNDQDPALQGWKLGTPVTIKVELRFEEIEGLRWGEWKTASSIECKYGGDIQNAHYRTSLKRKVHLSGAIYQCRISKNYSPDVKCRMTVFEN